MSDVVSGVNELTQLIPEVWSANIYDQLRADDSLLANYFSKEYQGEISSLGDTVKVTSVKSIEGQILTDDKEIFDSEEFQTEQFNLVVNKRAVASYKFTDLAQLQSINFQAEAQKAMLHAIRKRMEQDIIDTLAANVSTSTPDHSLAATGSLAASDIQDMNELFDKQFIPRGADSRTLFLDPSYYNSLLLLEQIASRDYTNSGSAETGVINNFLGMRIVMHNLLSNKVGYLAHPSALQIAMQQGVRVKVSDLHVKGQFGYMISADMVYGIKIPDGSDAAAGNKRYIEIAADN